MKKSVLFLAVIAAAMASCSKDEVSELNVGEAISFRSSVGTRLASSWTTQNIGGFTVGAAFFGADNQLLMQNVGFSKASGDAPYFTSQNPVYWPAENVDVTFYAYAQTHTVDAENDPENLPVGTWSFTSTERKLKDFSQPAKLGNHADLITAKVTTNQSESPNGVSLSFKHQLARVMIQAKKATSGYQIEVRGVRFCNIKTNATFDFDTEAWTDPQAKQDYQMLYTDHYRDEILDAFPLVLSDSYVSLMFYSASPTAESDGQGNLFSIPQSLTSWDVTDKQNTNEGAYMALYAQIRTTAGSRFFPSTGVADEFAWIAIPLPENTVWDAGKLYTYKIDFSNGFGYVDPEKGEPGDTNADPFLPGEPILGQGTQVKVSVTDIDGWTDSNPGTGEAMPM